MSADSDFDVLVVGAGLAGIHALYKFRSMGLKVLVLEKGSQAGGTWFWNRYPGARCDVESVEYSYQFSDDLQQQWEWTEKYATQAEILSYINHVVDRFELRRHIHFSTRVDEMEFDEDAQRWRVDSNRGSFRAHFCVLAMGSLSAAHVPAFEGCESFRGRLVHTGNWPAEGVEFEGERAGVIGTGSSGIQLIPEVAKKTERLFVFQRTASYSVPARNKPLEADFVREVKSDYAAFRRRSRKMPTAFGGHWPAGLSSVFDVEADELERMLEFRWREGGLGFLSAFGDVTRSTRANELVSDFVRSKIRTIVADPEVAELLVPKQPIGCKRLCLDTGYYETFNHRNVHLVDVSADPIRRITESGLQLRSGEVYEMDILVLATGYDAITGAMTRIDIRNREGEFLGDVWNDNIASYMGLAISGFPNLFTVCGPGSAAVLTNFIVSIEHHVAWIADCLEYMRSRGYRQVEADRQAQEAWMRRIGEMAAGTVFPSCDSWYLGSNVPDKPRTFLAFLGFPAYEAACAEVAESGYRGFRFH